MIAITEFMIGMGWDGLNQKHPEKRQLSRDEK